MLEPESHRERVSRYCELLAAHVGLDPGVLRAAGWLHDVGMVAITLPAGALSAADRRALETHPAVGHALLAGAGHEPLDTAAELAWTHHERFDGGGYPRGLTGTGIPAGGRIAAVADTFDALTTERPYRAAVSVEEAAGILRGERGRQLDPDLVDAFVDALDDAAAILASLPARPAGARPRTAAHAPGGGRPARDPARTPAPARRRRPHRSVPDTAGGHRRFRLEDVLRLAEELEHGPPVRPLAPPATPLPALARTLRSHGGALVAAAAASLYREGRPGWFASSSASQALAGWVDELADGCERGAYGRALSGSEALLERAAEFGASLLECHAFLERFGQLTTRLLARAGAEHAELAGTRRLVTAIQQSLIER